MKLPFDSSQNNLSSASNRYEPKSVLDIRRSPPSPVTAKSSEFNSTDEQSLVEKNIEYGMINQFDEWDSDSLMRELGFDDDSTKSAYALDLPELPPFFHSDFETLNPNSDLNPFDMMSQYEYDDGNAFEFVDELIRIAECFQTQSFQVAQVILARLNQRLRTAAGKPLQRATFYFKEAFQTIFTGSTRSVQPCSSSKFVQVIKAYKSFSGVSPIPMFSSFTANQAILDAVDGAMIVHVIDFDIGIGGQWASFMKEIVEKAVSRKVNSPAVRITAVVPEDYETESRLIRDNLYHFARVLKLRFDIDFISVKAFEYSSFKSVKFMNGEKTAVLLSPTIFRRIGSGFVNDLRRVSPHVIVHIDDELTVGGTSFLRQTVIDGLEFYSTVLESLEAANVGGECMRNIETFVLLPKIISAMEDAGGHAMPWREAFGRTGMRPVGMSRFAEFQAECLLGKVQVRGFHVAKRQAEMVLCWQGRPLVAMSAWRC